MVQQHFVSGMRSAVCAVHHRHLVPGHLRHARGRAIHHHGVVHAGHGAYGVFLQGDGDQGATTISRNANSASRAARRLGVVC